MADKKCPDCPKCLPGWLVQFGDLMSLLLTFFILLLSMAVMDKVKVEEYFDVMKKAMGFLEENSNVKEQTDQYSEQESSSDSDDSASDTETAAEEISQLVEEMNESANEQNDIMEMVKGRNEFTLDIPSAILFEEGEYKLTHRGSKNFIAKIARIIRTMPQTFNIEIIGHTDRSNFKSDTLPRDNWDVSALRSISVVRELIKNRIDPAQLKVAAYGAYRPKSENAAENRRVELRFFAQDDQNNILQEESFFDRLEQ